VGSTTENQSFTTMENNDASVAGTGRSGSSRPCTAPAQPTTSQPPFSQSSITSLKRLAAPPEKDSESPFKKSNITATAKERNVSHAKAHAGGSGPSSAAKPSVTTSSGSNGSLLHIAHTLHQGPGLGQLKRIQRLLPEALEEQPAVVATGQTRDKKNCVQSWGL